MRLNMKTFLIVVLAGWMTLAAGVLQAQSSTKRSGAKRSRAKRSSSTDTRDVRKIRVTFNPTKKRDPMLSADDMLLLEYQEKQRLAALEAERKRKEEEERKRIEAAERERQWQLILLKDPSIVVRDKIKIGGIIDKEVLIGGKLYTIGNTYLGARIIDVGPDSVTFSYKGQKFVKKLKL